MITVSAAVSDAVAETQQLSYVPIANVTPVCYLCVTEQVYTKFSMGDYVSDITPHAKIQNDCPIEGVWAHG